MGYQQSTYGQIYQIAFLFAQIIVIFVGKKNWVHRRRNSLYILH